VVFVSARLDRSGLARQTHRRCRPDPRPPKPQVLHTGDALDFWRVERIQRPKLLRLRAEMRTPGGAWLEWRLESRGAQLTRLHQRAIFFPRGLAGRLYWYSLLPFHGVIFTGMLNKSPSPRKTDPTWHRR
jgi:hypothetical protein